MLGCCRLFYMVLQLDWPTSRLRKYVLAVFDMDQQAVVRFCRVQKMERPAQ